MLSLHRESFGFFARQALKNLVGSEAKNVVNARGFLTPFHRLVAAVMAVATYQDFYVGPMLADTFDDMLENRANLFARRRLARAQDHRHRLAACRFVDVDRQKAAFIVMSVEQRKLLMAMHRVAGIIYNKRDRGRWAPVALTERI